MSRLIDADELLAWLNVWPESSILPVTAYINIIKSKLTTTPDTTDAISRGATIKEVEGAVYDICHSLAQPSMQGKTWGEIRQFTLDNIIAFINSLPRIAQAGVAGKPVTDDKPTLLDLIEALWGLGCANTQDYDEALRETLLRIAAEIAELKGRG